MPDRDDAGAVVLATDMFAPALVTNADGTVTANPDGGIPFNEDVTIASLRLFGKWRCSTQQPR